MTSHYMGQGKAAGGIVAFTCLVLIAPGSFGRAETPPLSPTPVTETAPPSAAPAPGTLPAAPAPAPTGPPSPAPRRLSLDDAVRFALRESPSLRSTRAESRAVGARVRAARAETRPHASATTYLSTGAMGSILATPPGVAGPANVYAVPPSQHVNQDVMLMFPLWSGGRLAAGVRSARAESVASQADVEAMAQDVALGVREAYRRALYARANVTVFDERVREEEERVRVAGERYDVGRAPKVDLLRARSELAAAQQEQTDAARDAEIALSDLRVALGMPGDDPLDLTDTLDFVPEAVPPGERLDRALRSRPELRAAQSRIRAAEAEVSRMKAAYRPQVQGVAMADLNATRRAGSMGGTTLGVVAGLPLLDAGLRRAGVEEAEARLEKARAEEQAVRLRLEGEVRRASLELAAAAANVARSEAVIASAEEEYRLARLRSETGRSILVEVLDAFTALTRARTNWVKALYEHSVARDRLDRAMGTPVPPDSPGAP